MSWLAESILRALAESPGERTVAELAARLQRDHKAIGAACVTLHRRGLAQRAGLGRYGLAPDGRALLDAGGTVRTGQGRRPTPRAQNKTLRHRLWIVLGNRRKATLPELLTLAVAGGERDAETNAQRYLRLLERTGYLMRLSTRAPGIAISSPGHIKWLVVRWTGPRAPQARHRHTAVYDPNLGEIFLAEGLS